MFECVCPLYIPKPFYQLAIATKFGTKIDWEEDGLI